MASPVLVRFHSGGNPHLAAELQTAQYHRLRSCAGQRFFIANIVGEGDPHLDLLTLLGGRKRVAGTGSPCYVGTVRKPLVTVGYPGQAFLVCNLGRIYRQRLPHLGVPLIVGAPVAGVFAARVTVTLAIARAYSTLTHIQVDLEAVGVRICVGQGINSS